MNDSTTTATNGETITINESFTIAQAIGEIRSLSRQTALITRQAEQLAVFTDKIQDKSEQIYDLSFMATTSLERMAALAEQLDEMILVERTPQLPLTPPATKPALDVFIAESFRITALSKSLTAWLMDAKPTDSTECGEMDINTGDGLELAHMILTSSQAILKAANEVQK